MNSHETENLISPSEISNPQLGVTKNPYVYAGFWLRMLAEIIDSIVLTFLTSAIAFVIYRIAEILGFGRLEDANGLLIQAFEMILFVILSTPYYVYGHYRYGTTVGKVIFKIRVYDYPSLGRITLKQSWMRFTGYGVSYLTLGVGFLIAAFHPEKRALHDLISKTVSLRRIK